MQRHEGIIITTHDYVRAMRASGKSTRTITEREDLLNRLAAWGGTRRSRRTS